MASVFSLKTTYVDRQDPSRATMSYDAEVDTLYIHLDVFGSLHVACYLDDGVYALFDPETLEVVGFQVENWRSVFLTLHPDLAECWPPPDPQQDQCYILQTIQRYAPNECAV
ncbi:MAG: hypothetical protein ISS56_17695 [Anaerolineae bacterium]|nr:hypothetical protein [Anaerolineae bacterium]